MTKTLPFGGQAKPPESPRPQAIDQGQRFVAYDTHDGVGVRIPCAVPFDLARIVADICDPKNPLRGVDGKPVTLGLRFAGPDGKREVRMHFEDFRSPSRVEVLSINKDQTPEKTILTGRGPSLGVFIKEANRHSLWSGIRFIQDIIGGRAAEPGAPGVAAE